MGEQRIRQLFGYDFSKGTEEFRDELLERCLSELDSDNRVLELDDEALELLSAAGDATLFVSGEPGSHVFFDGRF